jgi:hypothetical protein
MPYLHQHSYSVALKSDGVRYVLFLTTRPEGTNSPVALMIDRARNMYEVDVVAPSPYFVLGTAVEGELVWQQPDERRMLFLVFDAVQLKGVKLVSLPFEERLHRASQATKLSADFAHASSQHAQIDTHDSIVLQQFDPEIVMQPKAFVALEYSKRVWDAQFEATHRVDGLILMRSDAVYKLGSANDGSAFKWKQWSTIDLAGSRMCTSEGSVVGELLGMEVVVDRSKGNRIRATNEEDVIEYFVQCVRPDGTSVVLFPLRRRTDKKIANGNNVVVSTIRDVVDNIAVDELSAAGSASP